MYIDNGLDRLVTGNFDDTVTISHGVGTCGLVPPIRGVLDNGII